MSNRFKFCAYLARAMERVNVAFQMETNLQDVSRENIHFIHNNMTQRNRNRNKTGYKTLRSSYKIISDCLIHTDAHILVVI